MKFKIISFGCKVNQYESHAVSAAMESAGFESTDENSEAQIIIINTCTVTGKSDDKSIKLVNTLRRHSPQKILALIGCFPQAYPQKAAELPVDIIAGSTNKANLPFLILDYLSSKSGKTRHITAVCDTFEELPFNGKLKNTRGFLKIEDGCDRRCSYCIIPTARGKVRSRTLDETAKEAARLSRLGCKEIVLVGINLSLYGSDIGLSLSDAVNTVSQVEGISRVRLSSLEPQLMDKAFIQKLSENKKLCPHFHLSLQSGCDETLKRMNRGYTARDYLEIVNNIRAVFENPGLTTDIMVGFSGESDDEFCHSLKFVEEVKFSKIHVFTYSPREGTPAAEFQDKISDNVKRQRYKQMSELALKLNRKWLEKQVGTTQELIVEKTDEYIEGHTKNYTPVRIYNTKAERGSEITSKIFKAGEGYCEGEAK
ncbi:MAG: tRNA (N(6)-L-threonylcarbamoyladenosine(37)-C(2))-methylthiotransferase MtaB [Oscillospiraceae bacterium]|nr:tRNA (N(6)-L-threonylcarbamoyladenosine(37)-C(2))-methylthiotransferase MtaB [Oscillospiraceae bacterium]